MLRRPPRSPRFPYTTLFRSVLSRANGMRELRQPRLQPIDCGIFERAQIRRQLAAERVVPLAELGAELEQPRQAVGTLRSEEHTSELQSPDHLVFLLLLEKKN